MTKASVTQLITETPLWTKSSKLSTLNGKNTHLLTWTSASNSSTKTIPYMIKNNINITNPPIWGSQSRKAHWAKRSTKDNLRKAKKKRQNRQSRASSSTWGLTWAKNNWRKVRTSKLIRFQESISHRNRTRRVTRVHSSREARCIRRLKRSRKERGRNGTRRLEIWVGRNRDRKRRRRGRGKRGRRRSKR